MSESFLKSALKKTAEALGASPKNQQPAPTHPSIEAQVDRQKHLDPEVRILRTPPAPPANKAEALENALLKPKPPSKRTRDYFTALHSYRPVQASETCIKRLISTPAPYQVKPELRERLANIKKQKAQYDQALAAIVADPDGKRAFLKQQNELTQDVLKGRETQARETWTLQDFKEDVLGRRAATKEALRTIAAEREMIFKEISADIGERAWAEAEKLLAEETQKAESWGAEFVASKQLAMLICTAAHPEKQIKPILIAKFNAGQTGDLNL